MILRATKYRLFQDQRWAVVFKLSAAYAKCKQFLHIVQSHGTRRFGAFCGKVF